MIMTGTSIVFIIVIVFSNFLLHIVVSVNIALTLKGIIFLNLFALNHPIHSEFHVLFTVVWLVGVIVGD